MEDDGGRGEDRLILLSLAFSRSLLNYFDVEPCCCWMEFCWIFRDRMQDPFQSRGASAWMEHFFACPPSIG